MFLFSRLAFLKRSIPSPLHRVMTESYGAALSSLSRIVHRDYDPDRTILLASSPRSGSTWLLNIVSTLPRSSPIFEPLRWGSASEMPGDGREFAPRIPPFAVYPEMEDYLRQVFSGHLLSRWSSNYASVGQWLRARCFVVKFVRANRMIGWLEGRFPHNRRVVILRHPCAVVSSLMLSPGDWSVWAPGDVIEPIERMFGESVRSLVGPASSREELLAAYWAADTLAVLAETHPGTTLLLTYEQAVVEPGAVLQRLFGHLGEPIPAAAMAAAGRASQTTRSDSAIRRGQDPNRSWLGKLSGQEVANILRVVHGFGLTFYGSDPEADLAALATFHRKTPALPRDIGHLSRV